MVLNKEELLKLYVGKNYDNIIKGGYSYNCLFFGWIYLFYRKNYLQALVLFIMQFIYIIGFLFLINYSFFYLLGMIILFIQFVIGISFNKNYIIKANDYIDYQIKNNVDYESIKKNCINNGGINKNAFLFLILFIQIYFILDYVAIKVLRPDEITIHFDKSLAPYIEDIKEKSYMSNNYNYSDVYIEIIDKDNDCNFSFLKNNEYINEEISDINISNKYLSEKHNLNINLEKININNLDFNYYKNNNNEYYLFSDKVAMYFFKFEINKESDGKCTFHKEYILNNFEYK